MTGPLRRIAAGWRRHPVLWTLFPLAVVATLFFGAQAMVHAIYWADPAHRDQALQGWMTPRYVVKSWDLPREVMLDLLGESVGFDGGPPTLERIARTQGISLDELIARIEAAIAAHRAASR